MGRGYHSFDPADHHQVWISTCDLTNKHRNPVANARFRPPIRWVLLIVALLTLGLFLAGCTSTGKAPVYDRNTHGHYKRAKVAQYKVRKGDTLYAVAWKAGVDFRTLAKWNGLKSPYTIYPGQLLRLKAPEYKKKSTTASRNTKKKRASSKPASKTKSQKTTKAKTSGKATASVSSKQQPVSSSGKLRWSWPTNGAVISRYAKGDTSSKGIRIGGTSGQKISATEAGKVVYVGSGLIGYGRLIIIKHNEKYLSAYAHNSKLRVKEGEQVKRGEHIADMGVDNTGKPMLHFEIRRYGKPINPMSMLPKK